MHIRISIPQQSLELHDERGTLLRRYAVSTAKNGAGEMRGSNCTPRGRHVVRARIGAGAAPNTVFRGRRPTGEIWTPALATEHPGRDWILTRILWLSGKEPGRNRLGSVDTMRRYIYLHGSPDTAMMGVPGSIGCVRMRNVDILELFDLVPIYTRVDIVEFGVEAGSWTQLECAASELREAVFVIEQSVPRELEIDGRDPAIAPAPTCASGRAPSRGAATGARGRRPSGHQRRSIGSMSICLGPTRPFWRSSTQRPFSPGIPRAMITKLLLASSTCTSYWKR